MCALIFQEETYQILGAAMEVHRVLGAGFLESVYQEALECELRERNIPFDSQKPIKIQYKNRILEKGFIVDLLCYNKIIIELKALEDMGSKENAQLLNYLKASGLKLGLLINFGVRKELQWKRIAN